MNFIIQKKYVKREPNKSNVKTAQVLTQNREEVEVFRTDLQSAFYALLIRHSLVFLVLFSIFTLWN